MDNVLLVGVAFSVLLSTALVLLGVDTASSAIIGLSTTVISLLLDLMVRVSRTERKLIEVSRLSHEAVRDAYLLDAMSSIAEDYHQVVASARYDLFVERARSALSECRDTMHNLVEGYMSLPPLSQFSFGLKGLAEVKLSLKATSYVDAENFWNSVAGTKYFQANVSLIDQGVRITRVFIGDRTTLSRFRPIILRQRRAGIRVLIALANEIPLEACEDYLIFEEIFPDQT